MNKRDRVYLQHIRDAIGRIERYVQPVSREEFFEDEMRQDAVIRQLSIIGEAAGDLSEEFQQEYPSTPWSDIYGMRNKLVHDYFGVDLEAVWDTGRQDVSLLSRMFRLPCQRLRGSRVRMRSGRSSLYRR